MFFTPNSTIVHTRYGRVEIHKRWQHGERPHAGRIYVGAPSPEDLPLDHPYHMPVPPWGSKRGDGSAEDKLWRTFNRLELRIMKEMLADATRQGVRGVDPGTTRFSRKAGCSCGCSPGFVSRVNWARDIYVSLVKESAS